MGEKEDSGKNGENSGRKKNRSLAGKGERVGQKKTIVKVQRPRVKRKEGVKQDRGEKKGYLQRKQNKRRGRNSNKKETKKCHRKGESQKKIGKSTVGVGKKTGNGSRKTKKGEV